MQSTNTKLLRLSSKFSKLGLKQFTQAKTVNTHETLIPQEVVFKQPNAFYKHHFQSDLNFKQKIEKFI